MNGLYHQGLAAFRALGDIHIPLNNVPEYMNMTQGITIPNDDRLWYTFMTTVIHAILYWTINSMFLFMEVNGYFDEYKLERRGVHAKLNWKLLRKTWTEAVLGQFISTPLFVYFAVYPAAVYFGMPPADSLIEQNMLKLYLCFLGCTCFNDWGFYWSHRIFHHKAIYKRFHKQHHSYIATIGFAAEYAHPVEQIFANQLPTVGACLFFGYHPFIWYIWLVWRLEQTYEGHSGYAFVNTIWHKIGLTNASTCAYHDHHHMKNSGNFGAEYLDWMFGTMDAWVHIGGEDGYVALKKLGKKSKIK
jgi:sterol desaturase/sphingolipid hydroxylase (fatty acid hydroxylase superfamily)